jgi:CheY-like chemotaxis protein
MIVLDQITTDVSPRRSQHRKRVMVVEDEGLLALLVTEQVADLGYIVVGPACTMVEARKLATTASIDGALLDLKLHDVLSHEVANILTLRQIPFAFITGYNEPPDGLYKNIDVLHKPFQLADLARTIEGVLTKHTDHGDSGVERKSRKRLNVDSLQKL